MNGIDTDEKEETEQEVLESESSRQGISLENSKTVSNNLEKYNAEGI